jgi:hypothetical protein
MVLILSYGCSGIEVSHDFNQSKEFAGLKTYEWKSKVPKKTDDIRLNNTLLHARIREAVEHVLSQKGFQKVSQDEPDFHIGYDYSIRAKVESDTARTGVGFGMGIFGRHGGIGISSGNDVREYDEGMLVIDVMDPKTGDLMWRGIGTRPVYQHPKPEKTTQVVNETVEKILAQFPPQPKK